MISCSSPRSPIYATPGYTGGFRTSPASRASDSMGRSNTWGDAGEVPPHEAPTPPEPRSDPSDLIDRDRRNRLFKRPVNPPLEPHARSRDELQPGGLPG